MMRGNRENAFTCLLATLYILFFSLPPVFAACPSLSQSDCGEDTDCAWDAEGGECITVNCEGEYDEKEGCDGDADCEWDASGRVCRSKAAVRGLWGRVEEVSDVVFRLVAVFLGRPDRAEAARRGVEIPRSAFAQLILFYLLPIAALSSILADLFFLFGLFRAKTAKWMGLIIALFGSRVGLYTEFIVTLGSVFGGFIGGMFGLVLLTILGGYVVSHVMIGFKKAKQVSKVGVGHDYLERIGEHAERLERE